MMNSREKILQAVAANKPDFEELPLLDLSQAVRYGDVCNEFIRVLRSIGGNVIYLESKKYLRDDIEEEGRSGRSVVNALEDIVSDKQGSMKAQELASVHKYYVRGRLGVAENGAVWIDESVTGNRLLPFICQHLVIVLRADNIVSNMHDAYREINTEATGFGVFVAGPSRTADIEQNLVIGAHGPAFLSVYLI